MAKGMVQKAAGLASTRDAYIKAFTEGETDKSHAEWYKEQQQSEEPYNARWRGRPLTEEEK